VDLQPLEIIKNQQSQRLIVQATSLLDEQSHILYRLILLLQKPIEELTPLYQGKLDQDIEQQIQDLLEEIQQGKITENKLRLINQELERLIHLDPLTQIANRRDFTRYISLEWKRAQRGQYPVSCIMLDIDNFKQFNDTYGHQAGDQCLYQVAQIIQSTVKRPGDFVCRYGGEEFAIILSQTDSQGAITIVNQIRHRLTKLFLPTFNNQRVNVLVTMSMGVSTLIPTHEQLWEMIVQQADRNLYRAKEQGKNCYVIG
jgi:diguanylate cyclase (GGDEF)-like protein